MLERNFLANSVKVIFHERIIVLNKLKHNICKFSLKGWEQPVVKLV